jgi:hypothetical protein
MKVRKQVYIMVLVLSAAISTALVAEDSHGNSGQGTPPGLAHQSTGGGTWQSHQNGADQNGWQVQLQRFDDDSITGKLRILGSARIHQAQIVGQVTGSDVDGVLLDDTGKQMGTFSGSVFTKGASGSYTTADGDTGVWSWDGLPPGALDHRPVKLDAGGPLGD